MSSINLEKYYWKNVKIILVDDTELIGFVEGIDDAESNENGLPSITVINTGIAEYVDINLEEIKHIEIINN